jgi:hypothetical protein
MNERQVVKLKATKQDRIVQGFLALVLAALIGLSLYIAWTAPAALSGY